ncbi:Na/Pi cotransporter family protein [Dethiobacter alkaliphilus]|uniref:Na/Pi cotransporter family protein n=1 Tax=Dethiobacter alkaliphilus TaxID=427926 RepID=UPI0022260EDA|nr:Na/Pi cotransporter family protein [Dethiobacter alkaliphilus]MCW3488882.1 Na/Pi cotransporter family protein [Dethiobacter alkaliphilus]
MVWNMLIQLVGGLGLFLFGMQLMASGMQKAAGDRLRRILEVLTSNPVIAVLTGIVVTILVQSSSTTTVMVVGFANAGLMTLPQALGTILGANIGTTVTAQIVSFDVYYLVYPAIGLGAVLNFFGKRRLYKYVGQAILGFGILFTGMSTMSDAMRPLRDSPFFMDMIAQFGAFPLFGIFIGAMFTALVQSSSASTGLIIAMSWQGILPLPAAVALILGTNVGTCITALLASLGASLPARRAAFGHIAFNITGVLIVLLIFGPFTEFIAGLGGDVTRQTANAHTVFNVVSTLVVLPFFKYFVTLITHVIPGDEVALEMGPKYLDKRILKTPAIAIGGVRQECLRMATLAREMVGESLHVFVHKDRKMMQQVLQKEDLVDSLEKEIVIYLAELAQHSLTMEQSQQVSGLMHLVNDLERIGDHAQNIVHLAEIKMEEGLSFTDQAKEELKCMQAKVDEMMAKVIEAFAKEDLALAREVVEQDDVVDDLERNLRKAHIGRINDKVCFPPSGVIYLDVLSNFERIGDHATNIAQIVLGEV